MKVLFFDIETFANRSRTWPGMYDMKVIKIDKPWELASVAWKWQGKSKVHCVTRQGKKTDKNVAQVIQEVLGEADVTVAHNGKAFDTKSINTRLVVHGIMPPPPVKEVDTCEMARRYFRFNANSLDHLAEFLQVGRKLKHKGFDMWEACERNEAAAWREMVRYNKHDVHLLEGVYNKIKMFERKHPNLSLSEGKEHSCPTCGTEGKMQKRGVRRTLARVFDRYQCQACGAWSQSTQGRLAPRPSFK